MPEQGDANQGGGGGSGSSGGQGNGQAQDGNHGSGRRRRNTGRNNRGRNKFQGNCSDLRDQNAVYLSGKKKSDFTRTTKIIAGYIGTNWEGTGDYRIGIPQLELPTIDDPTRPADPDDKILMAEYIDDRRAVQRKREARDKVAPRIFSLILGQCDESLQSSLQSDDTYDTLNANHDVIGLLKLIRRSMSDGTVGEKEAVSAVNALTGVLTCSQSGQSTQQYYQRFNDAVHSLESQGLMTALGVGRMQHFAKEIFPSVKPEDLNTSQVKTATLNAAQEALSIIFLTNCSNTFLKKALRLDQQDYPETLHDAYILLEKWDNEHGTTPLTGDQHYTRDDRQDPNGNGRGGGGGRGRGDDGGRGGGGGGRGGGGRGRGRDGPNNQGDQHHQEHSDNTGNSNESESYFDPVLEERIADCYSVLSERNLPVDLLVVDSGSTVMSIANGDLLHDIFEAPQPIHVRCNAGMRTIRKMGYLGDFPEPVWYDEDGIVNLISLYILQQYYWVVYDNREEDVFRVQLHDGRTLRFEPTEKGLYVCRAGPDDGDHWAFSITTVQDKRGQYTKRAYNDAVRSRRVQNIIGFPNDRKLATIIDHNELLNNPVLRADVRAATDIFGPNGDSLKGKTTSRKPKRVDGVIADVPDDVLRTYRKVVLEVDNVHVNGQVFLATISRGINYATTTSLRNREPGNLKRVLLSVIKKYRRRGFKVDLICADKEFEPVEALMPKYAFNITSEDEHMGSIERFNRTLKERVRSCIHSMPFSCLPRLMVRRLVANATFWLGAFPVDGGIPRLAPRYIMTGQHVSYDKHVRLEFGEYVQTHEKHSNDMQARTIGAICLGPTGNQQGGHYFLSLLSGKRISREAWTRLPMPDEVIQAVNELGYEQSMPEILTFDDPSRFQPPHGDGVVSNEHNTDNNDRAVQPVAPTGVNFPPCGDSNADNDDIDTNSQQPTDDQSEHSSQSDDSEFSDSATDSDSVSTIPDDDSFHPDDDASAPVERGTDDAPERPVRSNRGGLLHYNPGDFGPASQWVDAPTLPNGGYPPDEGGSQTGVNEQNNNNEARDDNSVHSEPDGDRAEEEEAHVLTGVAELDDNAFFVTSDQTHNAHVQQECREATQPVSAQECAATDSKASASSEFDFMIDVLRHAEDPMGLLFITEQMSAKKGIKVFGKRGEDAITAEMQQLHYRNVIKPVHGKDLTREQKSKALRYLMFLKEKRCGRIKGRGCADGRPQRLWKDKSDSSSPTVTTEAVFLTSVIDALEKRKVATVDVPGAFMQADMDELVHMKLEGELAELLTRVDPRKYRKYQTTEHGKTVIYVELKKALYGTLQAAKLFWELFSKYLVDELGFTINPHDKCVANKIINGKQCTIIWHVDDAKISHVEQRVVDDIIESLQKRFGQETPLTINRGVKHDYLGMTIDFSQTGKVIFTMDDYVDGVLEDAPSDMSGTSVTPAARHLFDVNPEARKLGKQQADEFHHMVAKLLYLSKRARPDLQTAIAFLCTRVSAPDEDDWKKLRRVITYLRGQPRIPLTLEATSDGIIKWWVDASFAVHPDCRSHTGATVSIGKGCVYSTSTRQKLNTKSSTEAELVGVSDVLPIIIWMRMFLIAQGYGVKDNVVFQDNQSAILLEKNGQQSSGRRTRHLNIRYFFITDRVAKKEASIKYCPTADMLGDFFTKPLQGPLFRKLRALIMNMPVDPQTPSNDSAEPQECVEDDGQTTQSEPSNGVEEGSKIEESMMWQQPAQPTGKATGKRNRKVVSLVSFQREK